MIGTLWGIVAFMENASENKVERLTLTSREVCEALGVSITTLWRLTKRGHLTPLPGLRHKLFSVAAVRRFAERGAA